jgi:GNAT superfamily N-acetyltransferase
MTDTAPMVTAQPEDADIRFLDDQINEFNFAATGYTDGALLASFVRDEQGAIVAGVYGWTWGGCCEIRYLWVHELRRGQGYGSRLLEAAEHEAKRRGCAQVVLDTHSAGHAQFSGARFLPSLRLRSCRLGRGLPARIPEDLLAETAELKAVNREAKTRRFVAASRPHLAASAR